MNKMKSKVVALMLVIPLLLILTTTTVVKLTEISVDIPVSEVRILGEQNISVDIADDDNSYKINAEIIPSNATNRKLKYSAEDIEGKDRAQVIITDDGVVKPLGAGSVRVNVTADSGRTASVQITYYSTKVFSVGTVENSASVHIGESTSLLSDGYIDIQPKSADYSATWESEDPDVVSVDKNTGEILGVFSGTAEVTGTIDGIQIDPISAAVSPKTFTISVGVTVSAATVSQLGLVFEGSGDATATKPTTNSTTFKFFCEAEKLAEYNGFYLEYDSENLRNVSLSDNGDGVFTIKGTVLTSAADNGKYAINLFAQNGDHLTTVYILKAICSTAKLSINKTDWAINSQKVFGVKTDSAPTAVYYVGYTSDNPSVVEISKTVNNECYANPKKVGTANIQAVIKNKEGEVVYTTEKVKIEVLDPFETLGFNLLNNKCGLQNEVVFAKYNFDSNGELVQTGFDFSWKAKRKSGEILTDRVSSDELIWSSSDTSVAVINNGRLTIVGDGIATISAASIYNARLDTDIRTQITVCCRASAVNVYNYAQLTAASDSNREVVLQEDVFLAPALADGSFTEYKSYMENICTKQMNSTADCSYYEDNGAASDAKIRYCLEFTNNVYGNGHFINAQYITRARQMFGWTVFNGPLNLVQLKYGNTSEQNASVKAQDNIVFLVKNNNISLNNVELKGCSDSSMKIEGKDGYDLTELDFIGTVLEIMGDNCKLSYSRVNNGRTVVRIFGSAYTDNSSDLRAHPDNYKINTEITNCILSYGREFILKIGSNQIKKTPSISGEDYINSKNYLPNNAASLYDAASPFFTRADGTDYAVTETKDEYFDANYVMTDVTLKDSVFFGSGLFCVGFESRFAGLCLHGYDYSSNYKFGSELGWGRVAGTSYPAALRIKGDVRFYDWKKVADVNSSTLIEGDEQILGVVGLNFNIGELITAYNGENADKLTVTSEGESYVNGAIAFYGGGKNYSFVDLSGVNENFNALSSFRVPLSSLGRRVNLIYYAAGAEDFRFMLYDADCPLSKDKQESDKNDLTMYDGVAR